MRITANEGLDNGKQNENQKRLSFVKVKISRTRVLMKPMQARVLIQGGVYLTCFTSVIRTS